MGKGCGTDRCREDATQDDATQDNEAWLKKAVLVACEGLVPSARTSAIALDAVPLAIPLDGSSASSPNSWHRISSTESECWKKCGLAGIAGQYRRGETIVSHSLCGEYGTSVFIDQSESRCFTNTIPMVAPKMTTTGAGRAMRQQHETSSLTELK